MPPERPVELIAPAGEPDAGYAALHYGADALYLGLNRFSARAEAANLSLDQFSELTAYAHSLAPRRRVLVTVNTVLLQNEIRALVELLARVAERGVDGVIVQDLGVARLVRAHFPEIRLHASTQMAIHNLAGAETLAALGFHRVVLARELTLVEIERIAANCGIETEVFIHGALCYSYSGLCLFSSMTRGQSGNRGRCKQPCRDFCRVDAPRKDGYAFSMKDLALLDRVADLRRAGVTALKVEGRMKSPLYVATVVHYYRRVLDRGPRSTRQEVRAELAGLEADMRTVFARPWTRFSLDSARPRDVVDRDRVGHRGQPIGCVESVRPASAARGATNGHALRFHSNRGLEVHDGLQIDVPGSGRPYGFAVDELRLVDPSGTQGRPVFESPAGAHVEVTLPTDHPDLPVSAPVYCASSQAVKKRTTWPTPKPGLHKARQDLSVELRVEAHRLVASASQDPAPGPDRRPASVVVELAGEFPPAREADRTASAAQAAFEKLGATEFRLARFECRNPDGLFVPVSRLNELRRLTCDAAAQRLAELRLQRTEAVLEFALHDPLTPDDFSRSHSLPPPGGPPRPLSWSVKADRASHLAAFEDADWDAAEEIILDIARDSWPDVEAGIGRIVGAAGRERIRLALPPLARESDVPDLLEHIAQLSKAGWRRWQIANLSGFRFLQAAKAAANPPLDVTADWPLYALNRLAVLEILGMGASGFTLSPEDSKDNMRLLLAEFPDRAAVIVYQDTPLFLSASCPRSNLEGGRCDGTGCGGEAMPLRLDSGESVVAVFDRCRTVVINARPFCLAGRLPELRSIGAVHLRADFIWRQYAPEAVRDLWRRLRAGQPPASIQANFDRGLA